MSAPASSTAAAAAKPSSSSSSSPSLSSSLKQLCHLVTGQGVSAGDAVLRRELDAQRDRLERGLLSYAAPTDKTRAAFMAKRKAGGKLTGFLLQLSELLGVEEEETRAMLSSYLAGKKRLCSI